MSDGSRDFEGVFRSHLAKVKPYSSARSEFEGEARVFLDANENALGSPSGLGMPLNRYPDPTATELREVVSRRRGVEPRQVFVGHGSDEAIELLIRAACEPGRDRILITPPTYGMYEVSAEINAVDIVRCPLRPDYSLDAESVVKALDASVKIVFLCSPNNPTGNVLSTAEIEKVLAAAPGLVVIDEAYVDFSARPSWVERLKQFPRLVVLQTLSKAWGMAGLRIGFAFADSEVVRVLNMIKPPYNVGADAQSSALRAMRDDAWFRGSVSTLLEERSRVTSELSRIEATRKIYPSDANFVLVKFDDARRLYEYLRSRGIIVRDRSKVTLCEGCLRITIGAPQENTELLQGIREFERKENV